MFTLDVETFDKNIIRLTGNESIYQVIDIDGLNPVNAQVNTSTIAGMDGALFNSSKLEARNVVLTIKINGDVEANRLALYKYFRTKAYCKIYFANAARNVYIEGYVETFEVNHFENGQTAQISIICPNPYFKDLDTIITDISKVVRQFHFPFAINRDEPVAFSTIEPNRITTVLNDSESETGLIIRTNFSGKVDKFMIRNTGTGEQLLLNYTFVANDVLVIDCNKGTKTITLTRSGAQINLIPYLARGSVFFQLSLGDNYFSYLADDGTNDTRASVMFEHYNVYRGV